MSLVPSNNKNTTKINKKDLNTLFSDVKDELEQYSKDQGLDDLSLQTLELMMDEISNVKFYVESVKKDALDASIEEGKEFKHPDTLEHSKQLHKMLHDFFKLIKRNESPEEQYENCLKVFFYAVKVCEKVLQSHFSFSEEDIHKFQTNVGRERDVIEENIKKTINKKK